MAEPVADPAGAVKQALEQALAAAPGDGRLRRTYFDHLAELSACHVGLASAVLPELPFPLHFRCASTDFAALRAVFEGGRYDFTPARPPRCILDLGGYAGYGAVFLAARFPTAQILTVEPIATNFRLLLMNTLPCRRIAQVNAAVGRVTGRVRVAGTRDGDRSFELAETSESGVFTMPAYCVPDLLRLRGWDQADFVVCDIAGFEATLFADVSPGWLDRVETLAIATQDHLVPGASTTVAASLGPERFAHVRCGEIDLYRRIDAPPEPAFPSPPVLPLLDAGPRRLTLRLEHVAAEPWALFLFEDRGLQLHPNAPGAPPAAAVFSISGSGQTRFAVTLAHAGSGGEDVVFRVMIRRLADGACLLEAARRVLPGASGEWSEALPRVEGVHEVVLQTEMAPGSTSHLGAWARWIEPRLT